MSSHKKYKLKGYLAGPSQDTFNIKIAASDDIDDLKGEVMKENPEITCAPKLLQIYKLNENPQDSTRKERGVPYDKEQLQQRTSAEDWPDRQLLEGPWTIRKCWRTLPITEERIHFMVVVPKEHSALASQPERKVVMEELVRILSERRAQEPDPRPETLHSLGNSFPLQQCDEILSHLRDQMLYFFRAKFVADEEWVKSLAIPIFGAASGTGKTAICSRFLPFLAHRARKYVSPPSSAAIPPTPSTTTNPSPNHAPTMTEWVSACESHPPDLLKFKSSFCDDVWDEARYESFRNKVIKSADDKLCLRIDLKDRGLDYDCPDWQALFAADLLLAYGNKSGSRKPWLRLDDLKAKFSSFAQPIHFALQILQELQPDDIIVIHVDETQHVAHSRLQDIVSVLISQMHSVHATTVPWIFPIFSGLSLESLMKAGHASGVTYKRYTPPVLTIESMLKIISHVIYENHQIPQPQHHIRHLQGQTFRRNYSRQVDSQAFDKRMGTLVDRDAIRAGLERIKDAEWGFIFERLATLMQTDKICTNLNLLRRDRKLLRRLFHMNFLGETIDVSETFEIGGKTASLSQLFEYGWMTIVDSTAEGTCTVFLPFLTLYKSAPDDPHAVYHPHLTPLCKGMEWRLIERDDARMLQYRINREFEGAKFDISISDIFGGTEHLKDVHFHLFDLHEFDTLTECVQKHEHLHRLQETETKSTIYLNAEKAAFADSFVFLRSHSKMAHLLCIQSKFLQSDNLSITYSKVKEEYKKVADVCRSTCCSFPFTLVILADRVGAQCQSSIARDSNIRSSVLLLDSVTIERFYGKPLSTRRRIFSGLLEEPGTQSSLEIEPSASQSGTKRMREGDNITTSNKKAALTSASAVPHSD